jgi:hypothetical protein
MLTANSFRSARRVAFALIAATAFVACDDDPAEPDPEPQVASVRLTVGANSVTITTTSSPTLTVASGSNTVAAEWLKADGTVESLVTDAEFELRINQVTGTNLTWTATGARSGTLAVTGLAAGASTAAQVRLFHKVEQHEDFGPITFTVRVP